MSLKWRRCYIAESEELYEPHSLCCPFNPLLPHLFLVGESLSEQLQEEPLSPLVVVWITGGQLLHGDRYTEGPFYPETCSSTTGIFGSRLTARGHTNAST